jgi:hypothetical protein
MEESVRQPEWTPGPAWRAAEESGIDMSLVADSLRRPVWERIQQHRAALDTLLMLREAYIQQYGGGA